MATVTGTSANGDNAGPLMTAPVAALNFDPWHGQFASAPAAATVQPWWVQIAVCPTTVPLAEQSRIGLSVPTTIEPAAVTSATDATGVPAGAGSAVLLGAAAVVEAAAELGAADVVEGAADELLAADVVAAAAAEVVDDDAAGSDEQAAATASTAVPEAASTVRRGRERGTVVIRSLQGLSVANGRPAGDGCLS